MNYYIADTHFGCTNKWENRTLEYDKLLKENINKVVTNGDDLWFLGDIGRFGGNKDNEYVCEIISTLKGKKHWIIGNHCKNGLKDIRIKQLFIEICDYKEITDYIDGKTYKLVLSHVPQIFWNGQHKGWIHLYGHLHMSDEETLYQKFLKETNDYFMDREMKGYTACPQAIAKNVGCMMPYMGYTPRTLKEILQK